MADPDIVEIACARAWGVYLLINSGIDENDARRDKLRRFIRSCREAGANETDGCCQFARCLSRWSRARALSRNRVIPCCAFPR